MLSRTQTCHQSLPPQACSLKQQIKKGCKGDEHGGGSSSSYRSHGDSPHCTRTKQSTHCRAPSHLNQLDHRPTTPRVSNYLCSFSQLEPRRVSPQTAPKPNCQLTKCSQGHSSACTQGRVTNTVKKPLLQNSTAFKPSSSSQCNTEQRKRGMHLENTTGQHQSRPRAPRTASLSRTYPSLGHNLHNYFQLLHFSVFN